MFIGKVVKIDDKKNLLYLDNGMVAYNNGSNVGDNVDIVLRPENIKISNMLKKVNAVEGVVKELIYDGSSTKMIVDVGNMLIKVVYFGNDVRYSRNDRLNLYWDIEDMVVFGRDVDEK